MILVRRLAGITNTSTRQQRASNQNYYAASTTGKNATLLCVVGNTPQNYTVSKTQYTEILAGKGYRYCLSRSANTVWMDVPDGTYETPLNVRLTAVSNLPGATVVYTLDGSTPTAESSQTESGTIINMESSCTLTAGILSEGKVYGIQQRKYQVFKPHDITLYVRSAINWTGMTFYVWDNQDKQLSGSWPGKKMSLYIKDKDGNNIYMVKPPENAVYVYFNNNTSQQSVKTQFTLGTGYSKDKFVEDYEKEYGESSYGKKVFKLNTWKASAFENDYIYIFELSITYIRCV